MLTLIAMLTGARRPDEHAADGRAGDPHAARAGPGTFVSTSDAFAEKKSISRSSTAGGRDAHRGEQAVGDGALARAP